MQQKNITQLDITDVPQVYHNLKYNDGEIYFADNITSIPGLMKQFKVNFIAYVIVTRGRLSLDMNGVTHQLDTNNSLFVDRKIVIENVKHTENFSCIICAMSTDVGFGFFNKGLVQSIMHIMANPVIKLTQDEVDLMIKYHDLLVFKMDHPEMNFGRETMRDIIRCFAYDLLANINKDLEPDNDDDMLRQGDRIFRRFMLLLSENSNVNRSVKSTEMGFDNLSFFGKYVRKHLGLSPNNYRKANNYGK